MTHCTRDVNGDPLDASNKYRIHFETNQLPPVNAFWSLTAYNSDEFLIKNDLNRFALGDRDNLKYDEDGSLDLYIQSTAPEAEHLQNWLPTPQEDMFYRVQDKFLICLVPTTLAVAGKYRAT